jgi:Tol biopolymer transport system component
MATGRPPFPGRTSAVVFDAILNREPPTLRQLNPGLPEDLGKIIAKCLEKDPEVRYQNAADLRADLKRLKRDTDSESQPRLPSQALSPASDSRVASSSVIAAASRHKLGVTVGSIVLLLLLSAAGFGIYQWTTRPRRVPFQQIEINRITDTGDVSAMAFSPDAKYVAYLRREENGSRGLWIRHIPTNTNVQILPPEQAIYDDLTFSPDNNYVYIRKRLDASKDVHDLFRLPVLGGTLVPVAHDIDSAPSFSSGGKSAVFPRYNSPERGSTAFYSLNLATSEEKRVCTYKDSEYLDSALAPDGKIVAAIERVKNETAAALALLDLSTCSAVHFFRFDPNSMREPRLVRWMPDGRGLVLTCRDIDLNHFQLGYLSYPGREFHKITNDLNDYLRAAISGDGRSLAAVLSSEDDTITVFPALSRMTDADQTTSIPGTYFSWSEPGHMLVVESLNARDIKSVYLATKEKSVLFSSPTLGTADARLCTADTIVLSAISKQDHSSNIYRVDTHGGNLRRVTSVSSAEWPVCSPDGKWIVYYDYSDFSIRKISMEDGPPQVLVAASRNPDQSFAMARDRNEIVVLLNPESAVQRFAVVSVETGKTMSEVPVGSLGRVCALALTPDGKGIGAVPCSKEPSDIWIAPLDGTSPHQLTHHAPSRIRDSIWMFDWSPDGKSLAVCRRLIKGDVVIFEDSGK